MPRTILPFLLVIGLSNCHRSATTQPTSQTVYYPAQGQAWAHRQPAQVGMNAALLDSAVAFAKTQETTQMTPDFSTQPGGRCRTDFWQTTRTDAC